MTELHCDRSRLLGLEYILQTQIRQSEWSDDKL